jgi:ApaG protein
MNTQITKGIAVKVKTDYKGIYRSEKSVFHVFTYNINIQNRSNEPVQLISRHWKIYDSWRDAYEVEGEGVIGVQPKLLSGEHFQYTSGCQLIGSAGAMVGWYTFIDLNRSQEFKVDIPRFQLTANYLDN